jgi:hypothetical protein
MIDATIRLLQPHLNIAQVRNIALAAVVGVVASIIE